MKRLLTTAAAVFALVLAGCNKGTEGGTPGTNANFKVVGPTTATTIKQGNKETVKISLDRGSEFKKAVTLSVKTPDKLDAKLGKTTVKADEPKEVNLDVSPAADAPVGEHKITITGTPDGGGTPSTVEVTIKVDAK